VVVKCSCLRPLRSAPAVAIVIVALGVLATHDLPAVGHGAGGHDGIGVGELAAVCLAVTATVATNAVLLYQLTRWTHTGPRLRAAAGSARPPRAHAVAARAGPLVPAVLRL
jgi:hypothetical protein